jgi:CopG family transcriptional regulator / antitoxin EndoAI
MAVSTVNISFQDDLLREIDLVAKTEARSRSELIREAARLYIQRRQKWDQIFKIGSSAGSGIPLTETELIDEIKQVRNSRV